MSRFWNKVEKLENGCWIWKAAKTNGGYGRFTLRHHFTVMAHRYAYEELVGSIPDGLCLDHLCRNRACVNPAHLEPVTVKENLYRGIGAAPTNAAKTHCARGHAYIGINRVVRKNGQRHCRVCHNRERRESYWRRKARAA